MLFLVVALLGGGGAFYYFKFIRSKQDVKGDTDLDDFDFDDYDEDEPEAGDGGDGGTKMKNGGRGKHDPVYRQPLRKNDGTKTHRAA